MGENELPEIRRRIGSDLKEVLSKIREEVKSDFVISGSWPSKIVADLVSDIHRNCNYTPLRLIANDVDVYYGTIGDGRMQIFTHSCRYVKVDGVD